MVRLNFREAKKMNNIYNSRNLMVRLNDHCRRGGNKIYNSRNLMVRLNINHMGDLLCNLQQ